MSQRADQPGDQRAAKPRQPGLMFNLGAFFGEVARAVKTDVRAPTVLQEQTRSAAADLTTPMGPATATQRTTERLTVVPGADGQPAALTARRTTVQELTVRLDPACGQPPPGAAGAQ